MTTRRRVLEAGGGLVAVLVAGPAAATEGAIVDIVMQGKADGSHVWFEPKGVHVLPGQSVRWTNRDPGNSHTTTAYHPQMFNRPRRIPAAAKPWDSGYLLPNETFSYVFSVEGVYDFYCVPHEHAGMVGRIVVGSSPPLESTSSALEAELVPLPDVALKGFPSVEDILAKGIVRGG